MKRLVLGTTIYKRPQLTDIVLREFCRQAKQLGHSVAIELLCAGSEGEESRMLAQRHGFEYIETPNAPLSYKHNLLTLAAEKFRPDGFIYMGSDNWVSDSIFSHLLSRAETSTDFLGFTDIFFLRDNELALWPGYPNSSARSGEPIGPARYYSAALMNQLRWEPWGETPRNFMLDALVRLELGRCRFTPEILSMSSIPRGVIVDIKTDTFITDISNFEFSKRYNGNEISTFFPHYAEVRPLLSRARVSSGNSCSSFATHGLHKLTLCSNFIPAILRRAARYLRGKCYRAGCSIASRLGRNEY